MIPEIGTFAIILSLCFAMAPSFKFFFKYSFRIVPLVLGQFIFLFFAMFCLISSFLADDLSVIYVREHSHHLLPLIYRIGAAWGGHEGSLLLWCLILGGWTLLFSIFSQQKISDSIFHQIITVLGWISGGFIIFLLTTSNPFKRDFPTEALVGNDLTPILQDPGLIFHPPMLYLGYVGFAIAFAFAIVVLIRKEFDKNLAGILRPWVILPWSFLSCGIVLGSWWAYRELGWGGWWFWDPVENASLLPWLSATALLHSLIVTEKRNSFKGWTILLAIITFSLSLIGTFLVRSGVLVSVHAFASDPTRGVFLLGYLGILIGGALLLYSLRIKYFFQSPQFQLFSRETFLLINSVFLIGSVVTILLGTLYPIILDALNLGKISVGEPYFNTIFIPIMLPLLVLMGFAPHVSWRNQSFKSLLKKCKPILLVSAILGFSIPFFAGFEFQWLAGIGIAVSLWIILSTIQYLFQHRNINHASMLVAHLGIAILVLGITVNKSYSVERQVKLFQGESVSLAEYQFTLKNISEYKGPNYQSINAAFSVSHHGNVKQVSAEQRIYTHDQVLSKTGILFNGWRDIYIALGTSLSDGGWSIRIYYKPLVRWIWAGGFLLLLGGLLSLVTRIKILTARKAS